MRCRDSWPIDSVHAAFAYDHRTIASLVRSFKYRFEVGLCDRLARSMARAMDVRHERSPLIVPVPLHPRRRRWRGFDQAALLASALSRRTLFESSESLVRTRNTPQQVRTWNRAQRLVSVDDAFDVPSPDDVVHRDIILVDDVCTTGATLRACATALRRAGARSIDALVFARA